MRPRFAILTCLSVLHAFLPCSCLLHADDAKEAVLHFRDEGFIAGRLRNSEVPGVIAWQSPVFVEPLQFPLSRVQAVHYETPDQRVAPKGKFCFELTDNDLLCGDMVAVTDREFVVETVPFGRLHLLRKNVGRFYRMDGEGLLYLGPAGLADWDRITPAEGWEVEGGDLVTSKPGAFLYKDFGLPAQAVIEFELSWRKTPDFLLAFAVAADMSTKQSFCFEVWNAGDLVAVAESETDAAVASLQKISKGPGSTRIVAYLDQQKQLMLLYSRFGRLLARLQVHSAKPQLRSGLLLQNKHGDLRLETLRISRWNGIAPKAVQDQQSAVRRNDGSLVRGRITKYDSESDAFTVQEDQTEVEVSTSEISDVIVTSESVEPGEAEKAEQPTPKNPEPTAEQEPADKSEDGESTPAPQQIRLTYDNSQFSGYVTKLGEQELTLESPSFAGTLKLPIAGLRSMVVLHERPSPDPAEEEMTRRGRLEMDGVQMEGNLVAGERADQPSCLVWQPADALQASPIRVEASGRVVFREPIRPATPTRTPRRPQAGFGLIFKHVFTGTIPAQPAPTAVGGLALHLRSGDIIPLASVQIDERGANITTPISKATYIPHDRIKALEFNSNRVLQRMEAAKRDRLLTLPRMQKESPPTHLLCSTDGDVLRCRLLAMDNLSLQVEVRLENKVLPRDRIAQIIWLHPDEYGEKNEKEPPKVDVDQMRVQTLRSDGRRLTFIAHRYQDNVLSGVSDLLGDCKVDLREVDQLVFGSQIEELAADLDLHQWRLRHAVEPMFVQAEGEGQPNLGMQSPLVGQPAPELSLSLLDGAPYRLDARKGRVVVLDFWATWCGPCIQWLPEVEALVAKFADKGVELIAVNVEEQAEQIHPVLRRLELDKAIVALDHDGATAARYKVTAIPQTVVVDREGKVARLFIGGGEQAIQNLRQALQELTGTEE